MLSGDCGPMPAMNRLQQFPGRLHPLHFQAFTTGFHRAYTLMLSPPELPPGLRSEAGSALPGFCGLPTAAADAPSAAAGVMRPPKFSWRRAPASLPPPSLLRA